MKAVAAVSSPVLVLNRNYQPIHVTTAKRAFALLYMDMARALDRDYREFDFSAWSSLRVMDGEEALRTISRAFKIPRVILLLSYDRMPIGRVRFSRANVFVRDNYTCQYCHKQMKRADLNIDHVMPKSRGGLTTWDNVVTSCVRCNLRKGNRTPDEANLKLLARPTRPKWSALVKHPFVQETSTRFEDWSPFLATSDGLPFTADRSKD